MKQEAESVTIVIHPSGTDVDSLTVADAMQQVLDTFALLSKAEVKDPTQDVRVVWQLEHASTNSPFTVKASPLSSNPEVSVTRQATLAVISFKEGVDAILHGKSKPTWMDAAAEDTFKHMLHRNLAGIGRTDFFVAADEPPTIIDHRSARRAENFLELLAAENASRKEDLTRKEYGSVEGYVTVATTYYDKPAFRIRSRLTGRETICVLPKEAAKTIGAAHSWEEVFTKRRVLVSGVCHYNSDGVLTRVDVEDVKEIVSRDVSAKELADPEITSGRSPEEHLRLIWGERND